MYILDSNVIYWWVTSSHPLPSKIKEILSDPDNRVVYSVVTPWELSIKQAKGKLPLPKNFFTTLPKLEFACLAIEETHTDALRELPKLHGDPFDRMLVAQAVAEKMTLITSDKRLADYSIKTLLINA